MVVLALDCRIHIGKRRNLLNIEKISKIFYRVICVVDIYQSDTQLNILCQFEHFTDVFHGRQIYMTRASPPSRR